MSSPVAVSRQLSSGMRAVIEPDKWSRGSFTLIVDGTPQSHVDLDDPSRLFFEYVQRIGRVIDEWGDPGQPMTALHLGAGALTLPRYIEATRPGSRQQVIELEEGLVAFVREHLPLPRRASIRVRYGDARAMLARLPAALHGAVDLVVVDVFSGARIPAHVTSLEFYEEVRRFLAPNGILAVNVADGPGLAFARAQAATLRMAYGDVAALAETGILKGRRFGNVVLVASTSELPLDWMPRLMARGPHPATVTSGRDLVNWIAGAPVATDATAVPSPEPKTGLFSRRD
ncbi:fused MFS/spermidine synthase [Microcella alkalica]|uniref:SAM-dependent methyltransferase n=1 Tax=Microcella alkalica TaxID=355930 RepID=A0A839ECE9_9MICO|nr:fused MFS/spermidine synthase [Microcella alkalica]MBA8848783.1 SAM-dependent methyltransferase [Microcella alkalica]